MSREKSITDCSQWLVKDFTKEVYPRRIEQKYFVEIQIEDDECIEQTVVSLTDEEARLMESKLSDEYTMSISPIHALEESTETFFSRFKQYCVQEQEEPVKVNESVQGVMDSIAVLKRLGELKETVITLQDENEELKMDNNRLFSLLDRLKRKVQGLEDSVT